MKNSFFGKHLVTISGVTKEDALYLFSEADTMKEMVKTKGAQDILKGKIMAALFYEPSSRTFSSFITSMQRLGGGIIPLNGMSHTSVAKGETIADSARVFSSYADIAVMRHPEVGSVKEFSDWSYCPVVNAGDGSGEHPSQALLDSYTISKHFDRFDDLRIGFVGDLLYGRTVHSLSQMLNKLGVKKFSFISPSALRMPSSVTKMLRADIDESESLESVIGDLDVIYMTRVQKERFADVKEYDTYHYAYILNEALLRKAKKKSIVMHPLPRVGEIVPEIDSDPRCVYFTEEMRNGMYMRMAIIKNILIK